MNITNADLTREQKEFPLAKIAEINWANHKLEILSGMILIAGSITILATGGIAAIPVAAVIALIAVGCLGGAASIGYTGQKLLQRPAKLIDRLPPAVEKLLSWFEKKEQCLPALLYLFLYFQNYPPEKIAHLFDCYLIDQIGKEKLGYRPKSSHLNIASEEDAWQLCQDFIQACKEKHIVHWDETSIAAYKERRIDALAKMRGGAPMTKSIETALNKLLPWFENQEIARPALLFLFLYCRAAPEKIVEHFTAYVLDQVEKGALQYQAKNVYLNIGSDEAAWSLCKNFLTAFQKKKTEILVEELQTARNEKSRGLKKRTKGIRISETVGVKTFSDKDAPTEIRSERLILQEHRPSETDKKLKESKRSPRDAHPVLVHVPKQMEWLEKLNCHFRIAENPNDFTPLKYNTRPVNDPATGALPEFVQEESSKEEMEFLTAALISIMDIAASSKLPLKKAADEFIRNYQSELDGLDFPQSFYGQPIWRPLMGDSFKARGFTAAAESCMKRDEKRLEMGYQELLAHQEDPSGGLTKENYHTLSAWIDRSAGESYLILDETRNQYKAVLESCRETIIKKTFQLNQSQPEKERHESLKKMVSRSETLVQLDRKERGLRNPEALHQLNTDRKIVHRIAEIARSSDFVKKTKTPDALYAAVEKELLSADVAITFIELPVYFPERLHKYLEEYHRQQTNIT